MFAKSPDGKKYIDSEFLLNAYCNGFFPMADGKDGEIHWFSPERRGIIPLDGLKISRSLRQTLKKNIFEIRVDSDFEGVMRRCAEREDVWISESIIESYLRLFRLGYAHSVETWNDGRLVGGLYGVAINGAFFGESMFSRKTDASKVALVHLVERLNERGYTLLDAQYVNPHLATLGCIEISKQEYLAFLTSALKKECTFI
ncbi:MAG: leucyl/phenylalanyl-tRNA--protein transferase [Ignavibacteriales bacterium]|nr:leucyl/phenylalanyl-tRNA--protein transferase [Ignavibacteriales bacterium]